MDTEMEEKQNCFVLKLIQLDVFEMRPDVMIMLLKCGERVF